MTSTVTVWEIVEQKIQTVSVQPTNLQLWCEAITSYGWF